MNCNKDTKVIRLTTTPFVLVSQQWPNTYQSNENCRYLFNAPENNNIQVSIDELHLESHHDRIRFYQGNTTDTVFKTFTGSHTDAEFDSESNQMIVEFTTDGSDVDQGFHINLVAVEKVKTTTPPTTTTTTTEAATTALLDTTTQPDNDPKLLTKTDVMEDKLKDGEVKLMNFDEMDSEPSSTSKPEDPTIPNATDGQNLDMKTSNNLPRPFESFSLYFWIISLCFNFILIGILVYKYRSSLKARVGHAIQFTRNEFGSFVSISRSEQSQQTVRTNATDTTEMSNIET